MHALQLLVVAFGVSAIALTGIAGTYSLGNSEGSSNLKFFKSEVLKVKPLSAWICEAVKLNEEKLSNWWTGEKAKKWCKEPNKYDGVLEEMNLSGAQLFDLVSNLIFENIQKDFWVEFNFNCLLNEVSPQIRFIKIEGNAYEYEFIDKEKVSSEKAPANKLWDVCEHFYKLPSYQKAKQWFLDFLKRGGSDDTKEQSKVIIDGHLYAKAEINKEVQAS
ncbi:hypothetical protein [Candidatus Mycoplasma haematohominis]|uniref:hypothetical protein n=1 Tax=Candidatus Mycoplasma haematohominis TaxID=1494318 RepID=UPI001C0A6B1E|nr:hypothetical protein [Candidatus Mycoplasma haemohominis]